MNKKSILTVSGLTWLIFSLLIIVSSLTFGQEHDTVFVAQWNLENLFDTVNDSGKSDEEFLPGNKKDWTDDKLDNKLNHLARVIRSMNNNNGPDIMGVCEVEHQALLDSMITKYLNDKNYKVAYAESPDNRGIDNGLIYNANKFKLLAIKADTVTLRDKYTTRLILNLSLQTKNDDTIIVFVNHWPSRRGGEEASEIDRCEAAITLKNKVEDYLLNKNNYYIIIVGDFNDEPVNKSILEKLGAHPFNCDSIANYKLHPKNDLFNLAYASKQNGKGTYKYRDNWNMLDQIIVSGNMINGKDIKYICGSFEIYMPEFMVTKTGKYMGTPFPTYGGNRYLGGFSDHFPVTAKFLIKGL